MARDPSNRQAIEAELTSAQLEALIEGCEALGIRSERWREVPALRSSFEMFAVLQRARSIQAERNVSETKSISIAAGLLGLSAGAIRRTRLRWQKGARMAA